MVICTANNKNNVGGLINAQGGCFPSWCGQTGKTCPTTNDWASVKCAVNAPIHDFNNNGKGLDEEKYWISSLEEIIIFTGLTYISTDSTLMGQSHVILSNQCVHSRQYGVNTNVCLAHVWVRIFESALKSLIFALAHLTQCVLAITTFFPIICLCTMIQSYSREHVWKKRQ